MAVRRLDPPVEAKKKRASVDQIRRISDEVWIKALASTTAFVLHHLRCGVLRDQSCDCVPLVIGYGFGIDTERARA